MFDKRSSKLVLLAALGISASAGVQAATQGTLDVTSSSGDFQIDLEVPTLVLVAELTDIDLGTFDGASDSSASDTFCVYSNQGTPDVDITLDPGNTPDSGTAPVLDSTTTGDQIPYELDLDGSSGSLLDNILAAGGTSSNAGTTQGVATSISGFPTPTCATNFTVSVNVLAADMASVTAATDYTDTVTITVVPN